MAKLEKRLKNIGSIPSAVSRKWREILETSQQVKICLKALQPLQKINPNIIFYNKSLETTLRNIVPAEHYNFLMLKQAECPENLLENTMSAINLNIRQAREKTKLQEPEKVETTSLVVQPNYFKTKHGVFEVLNLPNRGIFCSLCEIFKPSKDVPHLVCTSKFSKFTVLEACPLFRDKSAIERFEMLRKEQVCSKCYLSNSHTTASCKFNRNKKYLKCSNVTCSMRYSCCFMTQSKKVFCIKLLEIF